MCSYLSRDTGLFNIPVLDWFWKEIGSRTVKHINWCATLSFIPRLVRHCQANALWCWAYWLRSDDDEDIKELLVEPWWQIVVGLAPVGYLCPLQDPLSIVTPGYRSDIMGNCDHWSDFHSISMAVSAQFRIFIYLLMAHLIVAVLVWFRFRKQTEVGWSLPAKPRRPSIEEANCRPDADHETVFNCQIELEADTSDEVTWLFVLGDQRYWVINKNMFVREGGGSVVVRNKDISP